MHLEDDLDCGLAAGTVTLNGRNYQIDLSTAEELREPLRSHAAAGRKTTRVTRYPDHRCPQHHDPRLGQ